MIFTNLVQANLKTRFFGRQIEYYGRLESTNSEAWEIIDEGVQSGALLITDNQYNGRGRFDQKWYASPDKSLTFSILLFSDLEPVISGWIPILSGVAIQKALAKFDTSVKLKWPNDILLKEKKVAGILLDTAIQSNKIESLVLGIGINFKINPSKLENKIKKTSNFYGVDTLVEKNEKPLTLVKQFLYELENIFQIINSGHTKKIIMEWTMRSSTIGRNISMTTNEGKITGNAIKLDNDGALIISNGQKNKRLLVGDITHKN